MTSPAYALAQIVRLTEPEALLRALSAVDNDMRRAFGRVVPRIPSAETFERLLGNPYVVEGLCENPYLTRTQRTRLVQHIVRDFLVPVRGRGADLFSSLCRTWGHDVLQEPAWTTGLREGRALRKRGFEEGGPVEGAQTLAPWVRALKSAAPDMPEPMLQAFFDWSYDHVRGTLPDPDLSFFARLVLSHDWLFDRLAEALRPDPQHSTTRGAGPERFGRDISLQIASSGMALLHPGLRAVLLEDAAPNTLQRAIRTARAQPAIARELCRSLIDLDPVAALTFLEINTSWLCAVMDPGDFLPLLVHPSDGLRYRAITILGSVPSAQQEIPLNPVPDPPSLPVERGHPFYVG